MALLYEEQIFTKRDDKRIMQLIVLSSLGFGYCLLAVVFTEYCYLYWASAKTVQNTEEMKVEDQIEGSYYTLLVL